MLQINKISCFIIVFSFLCTSPSPAQIHILFTANINGTIQNCQCETSPYGGLDRLKTFVDTYSATSSDIILVDGGDYLNSYPFPALNKAMLKSIALIGYDLMLPGENYFMASTILREMYVTAHRAKMLVVNQDSNAAEIKTYHINDVNLQFKGFLSPDIFERLQGVAQPKLKNYNSDWPVDTDEIPTVSILVYHGSLDTLGFILENDPNIDLVLAGHTQKAGTQIIAGKSVICTGRDGELVASIQIYTLEGDINFKIAYHKISLELAADKAINQLITAYKAAETAQ